MWPKEHGAYGQLAFPLVTGMAIADLNAVAMLVAVAAVASFLAHEPLLVLLGRRGSRVQRLQRRRAVAWLVAAGVVTMVTGIAAISLTMPSARWTFALPLAPAAIYASALARRTEKNTVGELAAAFAFSWVAVPMCVAAGVPLRAALLVGMTFALLSAASTLGVRVVVLSARAGGNPDAVTATRLLFAFVIIPMTAAFVALAIWASLSWPAVAAIVPGLGVSVVLAFRPPPPTRLRSIGWTLVAASAIAMVLLVVGVRLP